MSKALLEAALAYAAKGYPVFPVQPNKEPYPGSRGVLDATTDPKAIRAMWERNPRANIALDVGGAGMMCVEIDSYKPGFDPAALKALNLPETLLRSRSPRGGEHRFYALADNELVAPSQSKLARCVDVRSFHSYVLLPPSRTADGDYAWLSEGKPAYRTDEMVRLANSAREKSADRDIWIIEPDLPENVAAAVAWLEREAKPAIQGQGGDGMAYKTAAHLKSFGISESVALDLIMEHWNPRCVPPWGTEEIEHLTQKVANGFRYNTSPPGNLTAAYRAAKSAALFKPVTPAAELPSSHEEIEGRFRIVDRAGMSHIKPPRWLIKDFLPVEAYAMLVGAPGTFKSFIALDIALTIVTGIAENPTWIAEECGPVLYAAGEGRSGISNRVAAWEKAHWAGLKADGFMLADPVPNVMEDWEPFIKAARRKSPEGYKLVVLDTVGRAMQGANENSQEHASKLTARIEQLIKSFGCTVLAVHHTGYTSQGRGKGSMEFTGAPDTIATLERGAGLSAIMSLAKQKDSEEWKQAKLVKLKEVELSPGVSSLVPTSLTEARTVRSQEAKVAKNHAAQFHIAYANAPRQKDGTVFWPEVRASMVGMNEEQAQNADSYKRILDRWFNKKNPLRAEYDTGLRGASNAIILKDPREPAGTNSGNRFSRRFPRGNQERSRVSGSPVPT